MQQIIIYLGLPKTKSTFMAKKFENLDSFDKLINESDNNKLSKQTL